MAPRKRAFDEVDAPEPAKQMGLLERIRNMWEFAAVMQYIATFGDVVKIDKEFDINVRISFSRIYNVISCSELVGERRESIAYTVA